MASLSHLSASVTRQSAVKMSTPRGKRRGLDLVWSQEWGPSLDHGTPPALGLKTNPRGRPKHDPDRSSEHIIDRSSERHLTRNSERGRVRSRPGRALVGRTPSLGVPATCVGCRPAGMGRRASSSPPDHSSTVSSSSCSDDSVFVSVFSVPSRRNNRRQLVQVRLRRESDHSWEWTGNEVFLW